MEFSFCMNTHMSIVSIHAKNQRSRFFHFPVINECPFFKSEKNLKSVFLTVWPKNKMWMIHYI